MPALLFPWPGMEGASPALEEAIRANVGWAADVYERRLNMGEYGGYGGYGGGGGYAGGYQPGFAGISQFMTGQVVQQPTPARRQTFTMIVERDPMTGTTTLVDGYRGKPYLSNKDMRSFKKVVKLRGRLNRLFPRRAARPRRRRK